MTKVAAVDIGASSGRVLLATLNDGIPDLQELHRFRNGPQEVDGRWLWPFAELYSEVLRGLALAREQSAQYVGIDTWAVDYAVIDREGAQVGPVFAYRDPHHVRGIPWVRERVTWTDQYHWTGIQDMPINTIYQLAAESPSRVVEGNRILLVPDALRYLLTGEVGTEITNASSTSLVNPRTRTWESRLTDPLGIPRSFLGSTHEPGARGGVCQPKDIAGMHYISVATHDTASAFAGTPIIDRDQALVISLGTWALVGYESRSAVPTAESEEINLTHELGVDGTVRCLKNVTGMWLFEECRRAWEKEDGAVIDVPDLLFAAQQSASMRSVVDVDLPQLAAPGLSPNDIVEAAIGNTPISRGDIVRVILESLVLKLAVQIARIERVSGAERSVIHVVGGGSRIDFLMQWLADATNKVVIAGPAEAAALGNAVVQWLAVGEFDSLTQARERVALLPEIRRFTPSGNHNQWQNLAERMEWSLT